MDEIATQKLAMTIKIMKRPVLLVALSVLIFLSALAVKIIISGRASTYGDWLGKIEEETEKYKTENMIIKEELLTLTSLEQIASKAAELGFAETKSQIVFSKSLPLARLDSAKQAFKR